MVRGIVLAAGASTRMGRPKAELVVDAAGPTFAAASVMALRRQGVHDVTVVAGAHPDAARRALAGVEPAVVVIDNAGWRAGQLSSLLVGLEAVDRPDLEAVIVTLVDCPLVRPATVDRLLGVWTTSRAPVVRPAIGDRHGHPVIFDRVTFDDLRRAPRELGAKAVIARWRGSVVDLAVDDPGVLADIDTPADYDALVRRPRP